MSDNIARDIQQVIDESLRLMRRVKTADALKEWYKKDNFDKVIGIPHIVSTGSLGYVEERYPFFALHPFTKFDSFTDALLSFSMVVRAPLEFLLMMTGSVVVMVAALAVAAVVAAIAVAIMAASIVYSLINGLLGVAEGIVTFNPKKILTSIAMAIIIPLIVCALTLLIATLAVAASLIVAAIAAVTIPVLAVATVASVPVTAANFLTRSGATLFSPCCGSDPEWNITNDDDAQYTQYTGATS